MELHSNSHFEALISKFVNICNKMQKKTKVFRNCAVIYGVQTLIDYHNYGGTIAGSMCPARKTKKMVTVLNRMQLIRYR